MSSKKGEKPKKGKKAQQAPPGENNNMDKPEAPTNQVEETKQPTIVATSTTEPVEQRPTMLIDTCQGASNPVVDEVREEKPDVEAESGDEDADYDDYGNKLADNGSKMMDDDGEEAVAERDFNLTTQLGESLTSIPE